MNNFTCGSKKNIMLCFAVPESDKDYYENDVSKLTSLALIFQGLSLSCAKEHAPCDLLPSLWIHHWWSQ